MRSRVLTAIGLIPFVLGTFFCTSLWPILALGLLALCVCLAELRQLIKGPLVLPGAILSLCFFVGGLWVAFFSRGPIITLTVGMCLAACTAGCGAAYIGAGQEDSRLAGLFAPLWIAAPILALILVHGNSPSSLWSFRNPVLLAVLPLWGGDTAAIFVGKAFGKHPLAPSISPKKTVEGAIGNLVACCLVGVLLSLWVRYPWWVGLICGVCAGVFGQVGDLFESHLKRQAGVKDSGSLLPGHGGLLDRIDSMLFTAPLVYAVLVAADFNGLGIPA